jgi:hypothetical protein
MQDIQNLLNQVGIIVKKNNEILDATGGRFNIFNIIGIASDEVRLHSVLLAELLNPNGSHGMKDAFLIAFVDEMKKVELDSKLAAFDFKSAKVKVEKTIGEVTEEEGGRIDIIIEDKNRYAIIIENKIYAGDQTAQLIRYDNHGKKRFNGHTILYLTLDGHEASDGSAKNIKYVKISYAIHILHWLESCLSIAVRQPLVREIINQYISLIKQLTNQDMSTKNSQEIVDLLIKQENIESAFKVYYNMTELRKQIIENYLYKQLAEYANEKNMEFKYDENFVYGSSSSWFELRKTDWKHLGIAFYFIQSEFKGFLWTLEVNDRYEYSKEQQKHLSIFDNKVSESRPYGEIYHNDYMNWNSETFVDIVNGAFAKVIIENIEQLLNVIENNPELEL